MNGDRVHDSADWVAWGPCAECLWDTSPFSRVRQSVGVVSSRLPRDPARKALWLDALGHVVLSAVRHRRALFTSPGVTAERYLSAAASQLPLQLLRCPRLNMTQAEWVGAPREVDAQSVLHQLEIYDLPDSWKRLAEDSSARLPIADALVSAWPDQLLVLRVRNAGLLQQWLDHQFRSSRLATQRVVAAVGSGLVPESMISRWPRGAVEVWRPSSVEIWKRRNSSRECDVNAYPPSATECCSGSISIVSPPDGADDPYLKHWTRAAWGPWPDQTVSDYHASLLFSPAERRRSARDVLRRILRQGRLRASGRLIAGKSPMVCFTEVPFADFHHQRVFRPHLGRWDFEPYGIAIHRDWVRGRGGRPVTYGSSELAQQTPDRDRAFFQPGGSSPNGSPGINWRHEREWRLAGDVDLRQLSAQQALVFVPSERDAQLLAPWSPWPFTVLNAGAAVM